jgi:hypothetical protein
MLHHITARLLLWAMAFLALGMAGDFYIVCRMTQLSTASSALLTFLSLAFFYGAWFGYTFWKKRQLHDARLTRSHLKEHKAA